MVKGILVNRKADDAHKAQLKMEHADLVAEMQTVENLPTHERLQLARLRRTQQLKVARQKEKEWLKLQRAKGNATSALSGSHTTHHFRSNSGSASRHISFESSVVLLEAASRNDMHEVAELLERGITPDAANEDGLTALHQCCIDNNIEMLRLLLEYGANVDAQDSDKWTPLHAAATCGHLELVRILIDHGANLLAVNTDGNMPYDLCDDENTLDYIEAEMSKRGVTQELIDETRSSTERQMLKDLMEVARTGGDLEEPDYQGATPLHIAAANGYVRVVEFLLEMHVNVDAVDKDMWSPVHAAACWGHLEVLEMLAQCGADLNAKNKDDETPSDICEDPEIRERIEQLKTEQESKRLAEAQRRRVRRSQSNNTRAQSVRRTSLRDKTLTTKKDAVEEARLRLQAQEVFIAPDGTTHADTNGISSSSNTTTNNHHSTLALLDGVNDTTLASTHDYNWLTKAPTNNNNNANNNNNNNNTISSNNNNDKKVAAYTASLATAASATTTTTTNGTVNTYLPHSLSAMDVMDASSHAFNSRRPPEGRENDELQLNAYKAGGGEHHRSTSASAMIVSDRNNMAAAAASTVGPDAVHIQSSKEAANGKINVQVTVLVDTTNTHHHQQQQQQQLQQSMLMPAHTLSMESLNSSAATLANLKKQRSLSRTNNGILISENGSVLGAANNTSNTINNHLHTGSANNNNSILANDTSSGAVNQQPLSGGLHPSHLEFNNGAGGGGGGGSITSGGEQSTGYSNASSMNKFSGITGDVVSDSTSSKKCCTLM
ncbi:PREDICTED: protein phosphatase 1 regulatory inhibitor subunit 16B isoform X1 [Bactrocera latifrons]|uniref:Protein phosphatase 1 regulatory inhibitor subunit 16B n=2 Tax=Bactrocera latifrons TaxID=174628 RepID=A0A0K8VVY4_BACLA|nr:PREDICTED: protein phosphatase 1 regulatory inhibitor subunit 16B isoform X1 [Bactrocera latifrons]XP_018783836.1 PREDICTED: protein phosphatase 1 regulatory inhibitor subunit 16B isoform X1 [Bactrocera latifrons]XP_018783837.1 PREDICTED: protein phosphatase 1 regulatory inhibitor subunit 16B isoform X1 [Bactrocera latifrons]XP_018783838.1 PREDICTED: protein phosphatase 1 regulatory inhibitor subunit 16B isoform X1 [Bactrocera latifrons]XP_018783839.1 PREDICTED: protein phosphatase 1 regulat